jgi:hypothetical protein
MYRFKSLSSARVTLRIYNVLCDKFGNEMKRAGRGFDFGIYGNHNIKNEVFFTKRELK